MSSEEIDKMAIMAWMERNNMYSFQEEDGNLEYSDSMMICEFEEGVGCQEVEVETVDQVEILSQPNEKEALVAPSTTISDNVKPCSSKSLLPNNQKEQPFTGKQKLSEYFLQRLNTEGNNATATTGTITIEPVQPSVNNAVNNGPQKTTELDSTDEGDFSEYSSEFAADEDDEEVFSNGTSNEENNARMGSFKSLDKHDVDAQKYVEDYLDSVEDLPLGVQRNLSRIKELTTNLKLLLFHLEKQMEDYLGNSENEKEISSGHADQTLATTNEDYSFSQMSVEDILYHINQIQDEKVKLCDDIEQALDDRARLLDQDKKRLIQRSPEDAEQKNQRTLRNRIDPSLVHKSSSNINKKTENHQQKKIGQKSSAELDSVSVPAETLEQIVKSSSEYYEKLALQTNPTEPNSSSNKVTTTKPASRSRSQSVSDDKNQTNLKRQSSKNKKSTGKAGSVSLDDHEELCINYPRVTRQSLGTGSTGSTTSKNPSSGVSGSNKVSNSKKTQSKSSKNQTTKKTPQKSQKNLKEKEAEEEEGEEEESDVDSDEPRYCLCGDVSHGSMVCCDNDLCPIEWFHFLCVNLKQTPRGKWYCPKCRGSSSEKMKSMAEFVKELEAYNLQKELEHEDINNSQSSTLKN